MRTHRPAARPLPRPITSSIVALAAFLLLAAGASAEAVPLPLDAATGSNAQVQLESTSCPATGQCVAVGEYKNSLNGYEALIETESGGAWAASIAPTAALPGNAGLAAVSCPGVGSCVAVGSFHGDQGLMESETNGVWVASQLSLTGLGANADPQVTFTGVSCSAVGACTAAANYVDTSGNHEALVASDVNGSWRATEVDLSHLGESSSPQVYLNGVSCPAVDSCMAVGNYYNASDYQMGLLETENPDGSWTAHEAPLGALPSLNTNPEVTLTSVSCPAAGVCTAVGKYLDGAGTPSYQLLVMGLTNSVWTAAKGALPADANLTTPSPAQENLGLASVSCSSPGNCMAVGTYDATAAVDEHALELTESGGSWSAGTAVATPTAGAADPYSQLRSVACVPSLCTAVGEYTDAGNDTQELLLSSSNGTTTTANLGLELAVESDGTSAVACSPGGYCTATGYSQTSTGYTLPLLLDPPAAPTQVTAAIGFTEAQLSYTSPADTGGMPITGYTATANDLTAASRGGQTQTVGPFSGPVFTNLTPGDTYSFTLAATSALGVGIPVTTASAWVHWTKAQLLASMSPLLAPHGRPSRLKRLARSHGYTFDWTPIETGKVSIGWYVTSGRRRHRHKRLIGSGSAIYSTVTSGQIPVKLNGVGRRLVKLGKRLQVTASVKFVVVWTTATRTRKFTVH